MSRYVFERPTREKWAADAEQYVRTLCMPNERVSNSPAEWLTEAEHAELRQLTPQVVKAARRAINRAIRPLLHAFDDEPHGAGWHDWRGALDDERRGQFDRYATARSDRTRLNDSAHRISSEYASVDDLLYGLGIVLDAVRTYGQPDAAAERLSQLAGSLSERRGKAAHDATEEAVRREVARRQTDEAWAKQVKRWDEYDRTGGITITHH